VAVDKNLTGLDVVEAEKKVRDCRLSATWRANESYLKRGRNLHIEVIQYF